MYLRIADHENLSNPRKLQAFPFLFILTMEIFKKENDSHRRKQM